MEIKLNKFGAFLLVAAEIYILRMLINAEKDLNVRVTNLENKEEKE